MHEINIYLNGFNWSNYKWPPIYEWHVWFTTCAFMLKKRWINFKPPKTSISYKFIATGVVLSQTNLKMSIFQKKVNVNIPIKVNVNIQIKVNVNIPIRVNFNIPIKVNVNIPIKVNVNIPIKVCKFTKSVEIVHTYYF